MEFGVVVDIVGVVVVELVGLRVGVVVDIVGLRFVVDVGLEVVVNALTIEEVLKLGCHNQDYGHDPLKLL